MGCCAATGGVDHGRGARALIPGRSHAEDEAGGPWTPSARAPTLPGVRFRDESGQGAVEYAGALALIAVIFGALTATDIPSKVTGTVGPAVCRIVGGECGSDDAEAAAPSAKPAAEEPPVPIDLNTPFPVLPFPGSYEVSCTYSTNNRGGCGTKNGVSAGIKRGYSVDRSPTTLDGNGCPSQTLGIKGTVEVTVGGKGEVAKVGGGLQAVAGTATGYSVSVPPDQVDAISDGTRSAPNPVDPRSIKGGESVELSQEFYYGGRMQAQYHALQAEMGYDKGRKVSAGVQRVNDSTVRVTVGDKDFVRDSLSLGVGAGPASVALAMGGEMSDGGLRQVDIDISTQAGWKNYQRFITTGRLPKDGATGTTNPARSRVVEYKDSTAAKVTLGKRSIGGILAESGATGIETRNADGTVTNSFVGHTGDVGVVVVTETDAAGNTTPKQYSLTLENPDPGTIERYESDTGRTLTPGKDGSLRFDFSAADFGKMRQQAFDQVMHQAQQDGEDLSEAEVRGLMEKDPKEGFGLNNTNDNAYEIATAATDDEILTQLYLGSGANRDPNQALDGLLDFQNRTATAQGAERGDLVSLHPDALLPGSAPINCPS